MTCEGCGSAMRAEPPPEPEAADDAPVKWKCARCGSWCLAVENDLLMAAWLLEGREWPR